MDCLDVQGGTCIILFLIFAWNIGTPINLSTPRLYDVWFYSCCFSKHTHRCSAGFSLSCNTGHPSHVLILFCVLFHKYHLVASALFDFILTSFPVSQTLKAPSLCLLLCLIESYCLQKSRNDDKSKNKIELEKQSSKKFENLKINLKSPRIQFISMYRGERWSQKSQHALLRAQHDVSRHVLVDWPADHLTLIWADFLKVILNCSQRNAD